MKFLKLFCQYRGGFNSQTDFMLINPSDILSISPAEASLPNNSWVYLRSRPKAIEVLHSTDEILKMIEALEKEPVCDIRDPM